MGVVVGRRCPPRSGRREGEKGCDFRIYVTIFLTGQTISHLSHIPESEDKPQRLGKLRKSAAQARARARGGGGDYGADEINKYNDKIPDNIPRVSDAVERRQCKKVTIISSHLRSVFFVGVRREREVRHLLLVVHVRHGCGQCCLL